MAAVQTDLYRPRANSRGFTLIELLVVVAIIALLISILLPSLSRAREQARQVQCLSIERQIGTADAFYQTEYQTHLPYTVPYPRPGDGNGNYTTWYQNSAFRRALSIDVEEDAYRFAPEGLICANATYSLNNPGGNGLYGMQHSYAMNGTWGGPTGGMDGDTNANVGDNRTSVVKSWHPSSVAAPSTKIFMMDGTKNLTTYGARRQYWTFGESFGGFAPTAYRHFTNNSTQEGTANILFFDGHAEGMRYPDELDPRDQWFPYED